MSPRWPRGALLLALLAACGDPPAPLDRDGDGIPEGEDCDDYDAAVSPATPERCDGLDQDCDGRVDEDATDALAWYTDADADGWGEIGAPVIACVAVAARVTTTLDCDDTDPAVNPAAAERCGGVDADCDGSADDGAIDAPTWYADEDGDGYGGATSSVDACVAPDGHAPSPDDCDDGDATVHPDAAEACDGLDTNCDGSPDAGATDGDAWWPDLDGDGYGDAYAPAEQDCAADGRADNRFDCDDGDAAINPAAGGCGLVGERDAGDATLALDGAAAGDRLGVALRLADLDGDGRDSFLVGAPDAGSGAVYLFDDVRGDETLDGRVARFTGADGIALGTAIAAGDLDGDGVVDIAIGAPDDDTGGSTGGAAFLFPGTTRGDADTGAALGLYAASSRDNVGETLAVLDANGDGALDLALGAPAHGNTGRVYLVHGPILATPALDGETAYAGAGTLDRAGAALAAGDLDGDGLDELVIGAPGLAGAYVIEGGTPSMSLLDAATIGGRGSSWLTGYSVAVVPDLDGDGLPDTVVGGPIYAGTLGADAGEAWVLTGAIRSDRALPGAAWATFVGAGDDGAGWSVAGGDLDGDGVVELAVGAFEDSRGAEAAGAVYVWSGVTAGTWLLADSDTVLVGHAAGVGFGASLATGDLDGDGRAELATSATGDAAAGEETGAAYLYWGATR